MQSDSFTAFNEKSLFKNEEDFFDEIKFEKYSATQLLVEDVEFSKCTFANLQLLKCSFKNCRFEDCEFSDCDLSLTKFNFSSFFNVAFNNCKLIGIDWTAARKPLKISFNECKLNDSVFINLDIRGIDFINCEIRNCDFEKANLTKANFSNSDLLNSNFNNSNAAGANFTGAINYSINPNLCNIKKAKFSLPEAMNLLNFWEIIIE